MDPNSNICTDLNLLFQLPGELLLLFLKPCFLQQVGTQWSSVIIAIFFMAGDNGFENDPENKGLTLTIEVQCTLV